MSEVLLKHSRMPRKVTAHAPIVKTKLVEATRRPLSKIDQAERQRIATEVLERYIDGQQVAAMAADYKVSDVTIYALLLREYEDVWVDIQKARALARYERSLTDVEGAEDALSLARARETLRSSQWELERLIRRLYGQEQNVNINVSVDRGDRLRRAWERVIENTPTQVTDSSTHALDNQ